MQIPSSPRGAGVRRNVALSRSEAPAEVEATRGGRVFTVRRVRSAQPRGTQTGARREQKTHRLGRSAAALNNLRHAAVGVFQDLRQTATFGLTF